MIKKKNLDIKKFPKSRLKKIVKGISNEISETVLRCKKIIIKFSKIQRKIIRKWIDIYRWIYNFTIKYTRTSKMKSFYTLRKEIKESFTYGQKEYIYQMPSHILDQAINDVVKSYKTCMSNKKEGNIKRFRLRYKKKISNIQTICIPSEYFSKNKNSFVYSKLGIINSSESIKNIKQTCRLTWNKKNNIFILNIPVEKEKYKVGNREEICSIDPGIRTFQTLYSKKYISEFGKDIYKEIGTKIDKIENKKENEGTKWYRKYSTRLYDKIKHKIEDLHWKTSLDLVKSFDTILVGNMSTQRICQGNLNKKVKCIANMFSHYKFNLSLQQKAEQYGAKIIMVNEAYTSKTCGKCLKRNEKLGGNKKFKCPSCGFTWDRDYNGARNIMMGYFGIF